MNGAAGLGTFRVAADAAPYVPHPASPLRLKLAFRVDFTNGGYLEGAGFLLDLPGQPVAARRAAEMLVSALHLLRAGPVTIRSMQVVPRGAHDDGDAATPPS